MRIRFRYEFWCCLEFYSSGLEHFHTNPLQLSLYRIEHQTKSLFIAISSSNIKINKNEIFPLFSSYYIQTYCPISGTSKWWFTLQQLNHFEINIAKIKSEAKAEFIAKERGKKNRSSQSAESTCKLYFFYWCDFIIFVLVVVFVVLITWPDIGPFSSVTGNKQTEK